MVGIPKENSREKSNKISVNLKENSNEMSIFRYKELIENQLEICKKGLFSFENLDCSQSLRKLSDLSLSEAHPIYDCEVFLDLNPIDLIYLYNFRIFLFEENLEKISQNFAKETSQNSSQNSKISQNPFKNPKISQNPFKNPKKLQNLSQTAENSENSNNSSNFLQTRLLFYPSLDFSIQMISQPFKLVSTPLTHILTKRSSFPSSKNSSANSFITASNSSGNNRKTSIKFGFLTLDQNSRIVPLMASDPMVMKVPLIGVWIFGINYPKIPDSEVKFDENYLIWGILAEFVKNQGFCEKYAYDQMKKCFFLACFSSEENPRFYEVELLKNCEKKWSFISIKEEIDGENDYRDFEFTVKNTNEKNEGFIDEFLEGLLQENNDKNHEKNVDFYHKKNSEKPREKNPRFLSDNEDFIMKKKETGFNEGISKKETVNFVVPIPREIPKKEELITYLSPRGNNSSNNTFGIISNGNLNRFFLCVFFH